MLSSSQVKLLIRSHTLSSEDLKIWEVGAHQSQRQSGHTGIDDGYPEEGQTNRQKQWHIHIESEAEVGTEKDRVTERDREGNRVGETERGKGRETETRDGRTTGPERLADRARVRERRQGEEPGRGQSWPRAAHDHPGF